MTIAEIGKAMGGRGNSKHPISPAAAWALQPAIAMNTGTVLRTPSPTNDHEMPA